MTFTISVSSTFGEAGTLSLNQSGPDMWQTVTLSRSYADPVVVMGSLTFNSGDPCVMRVRNAGGNAFECQLDEWDYKDGGHTDETLSYVVV